jgi:hypothetical protein
MSASTDSAGCYGSSRRAPVAGASSFYAVEITTHISWRSKIEFSLRRAKEIT